MQSDWETTTLGTLGDFRNGVNFNREQEGHGLPVLKVKDFGDRVLCPLESLDELNSTLFQASPQQLLAENDIVVIRSNGNPALVGRSVVVQKVIRPTTFSGFCIRFRPDSTRIDPRFAAYFLRSPLARDRMTRFGSGTGIQNLNQDILSGLPIDLPELDEQIAISDVLVTLDDKIEQNRRTGAKLEGLARAVFKAWFVDFEPVKAKAAGATAFPGMPPETFAALPTRFVESELGPVPQGLEVGSLVDLAEVLSGGTPKTNVLDYWDGTIGWASAKDVSQCGELFLLTTERCITERGLAESATQLIPAFATVVVARGATTGRLTMFAQPLAMNQTCYALVCHHHPFFFNLLCKHSMAAIVQAAHGSVFDTITKSTISGSRVVIPAVALRDSFEKWVTPMFELVRTSLAESAKLATLRDYLLPRLLSGRVRVRGEIT